MFFEYLCEKISVCGFYLGKNLIACFFCKAVKNIVCGKMSGELFLGNFFVLFVCRKISWGKNSFPHPLRLVAVKRLEDESQVVSLQLAVRSLELLIDWLQLAFQCFVSDYQDWKFLFSLVHVVH